MITLFEVRIHVDYVRLYTIVVSVKLIEDADETYMVDTFHGLDFTAYDVVGVVPGSTTLPVSKNLQRIMRPRSKPSRNTNDPKTSFPQSETIYVPM